MNFFLFIKLISLHLRGVDRCYFFQWVYLGNEKSYNVWIALYRLEIE